MAEGATADSVENPETVSTEGAKVALGDVRAYNVPASVFEARGPAQAADADDVGGGQDSATGESNAPEE